MKTIEEVKAFVNLQIQINKNHGWGNGDLQTVLEFIESTDIPKPFDIKRCLEEDGGRCIYVVREVKLLSSKKDNDGWLIIDDGTDILNGVNEKDLQNIPRKVEEWVNLWRDGHMVNCTTVPYESKQEALGARRNKTYKYIGDPICIRSEEI